MAFPKGARFYAWTSEDESEFVKNLGKHSEIGATIGHRELLRRYHEAIKLRVLPIPRQVRAS